MERTVTASTRTEFTRERETNLQSDRTTAPAKVQIDAPQKQQEQLPKPGKDSSLDNGNQPRYSVASLLQAGDQAMNKELPPFWQTRSSRLRSEVTGENLTALGQKSELLKNPDGLSSISGLKNDPVIKEIILGVKSQSGESGVSKESDVVKIASSKGDPNDPNRPDRIKSGELIAAAGGRNADSGKVGELAGQPNGTRPDQIKGADVSSTVAGNKLDSRNTDGLGQGNSAPAVRGNYTEIVGSKETEQAIGRRGEAVSTISDEYPGRDGKHHPAKGNSEGDGIGITIPDSGLVTIFATTPSDSKADGTDKKNDDKTTKKEPERRQKYVVKKGDTLESIALKMLRNVKLNLLLFEINRSLIPAKISNGRLLLDLRPKLVIFLPTSKEIQEFCGRAGSGNFRKFEYAEAADAEADVEDDRNCFPVVPSRPPREATDRTNRQTVLEPCSSTKPQALSQEELFLVAMSNTVKESVLNVRENARVVKTIQGELTCFRLEMRQDELWSPVITYETSESLCVRHEFLADGRRKTIKIDLPSFAVRELAENDLLSNWSEYCRGFSCSR